MNKMNSCSSICVCVCVCVISQIIQNDTCKKEKKRTSSLKMNQFIMLTIWITTTKTTTTNRTAIKKKANKQEAAAAAAAINISPHGFWVLLNI